MTPAEALSHIRELMEGSERLQDDKSRKLLLQSLKVLAQKGLGENP
jgi:hypothetical protein